MATTLDRLPALALALALPLPFASFPVFSLGYWDKAEPMVVWFHAAAALAALAVAVTLWRTGAAALARVSHPVVLAPLALGLWSALVAPFTEQPLLSLLGAPQSGFGGLWSLDLAALVAAARLARWQQRDWRALGRLAIGVTLVVAAVKARDWISLRHGGDHWLLFVAAYYGWLALALPIAVERGDRCFAPVVAAMVALASQSLTALVLLALGMAVVWAGEAGPAWSRRLAASRWVAAVAVGTAALLPLAALQWLTPLLRVESLRDRHLVHKMIEAALAADPGGWLLGHGWGRTQDAFHTWINVSGERLWDPSWIFLGSDYFHSHDWALEALYAVGPLGMILTLAGFLVVPLTALPRQRPLALAFALGVVLFHGLWFQLCLSLPLMAMAMAVLADDTRPRLPAWPRSAAALVVVLGLVQAGAAVGLLHTGQQLSRVEAALALVPPRPPAAGFPGGDLATAELIRDSLADFARRAPTEPTAPIAAAIAAELAEIDRRAATTRSVLLLTTGLGAMAGIHVTGELSFAAANGQIVLWRRWLDRLLEIAPGRTDQAIPYFAVALATPDFAEVARISAAMLVRNPIDPVGLFYQGVILAARPSPQEQSAGRELLRRSLAAGIDRLMPIDEGLKRRLEQP